MDRYVDLTILPDPEFQATVLMSALFSKLHKALVAEGSRQIGVSFPRVEEEAVGMGPVLRVHGSAENLESLMSLNWLLGMRDHTRLSEIESVPPKTMHRIVRRVQAKSNPERLRRRLAKRKNISLEQARELIPETAAQRLKLPFVSLRSASTGRSFRLFIEHLPLESEPKTGEFSLYGLSSTATVPWF